jgi:hypothetical protein
MATSSISYDTQPFDARQLMFAARDDRIPAGAAKAGEAVSW